MHPSALEKSGFTTTLNMALSSTAPERSAETIHRKQLARFGKWLYRLGFVPGTAGNLSVRLTPDRILATQEEISHLLPPKDEYVITTSEFDDVKARLARIENKRKLRDGQNEKKPSLRRASTSPNGQTDPNAQNGSEDDRPTLHRRDN